MRLLIKVGLVPEPLPSLHAAGDVDGATGRWWAANLSLRNILSVIVLAGSLIAIYVVITNRITTLEQARKDDATAIDACKSDNQDTNRRVDSILLQKAKP